MKLEKAKELLKGPLNVVGLGLDNIVEGAKAAGATVVDVPFKPPAGGDPKRIGFLEELYAEPLASKIEKANQEALSRVLASQPNLVGVGIARDVVPGMADGLFLHAGPPLTWEKASGPMRGAIIGGILLEGLAQTPEEAEKLAASGGVRLEPCHHHHAVGPMAGVMTPSMPVWIVEDKGGTNAGNRTFCTLNEGLGKVLRYGAYSEEVITRLRFMADTLAPMLAKALEARGPIDLKLLMAQALQMGDEGHNRNRAGTSLLFRELAPAMVKAGGDSEKVAKVLTFINSNDHFFLNLTMPMAKCMLMAAEGVPYASMLSVMARNGTEFGIQLASMPGRWFTGAAQIVRGLYFPGFDESHANPDIGDSAITETSGIGAFCMAAAPAIVQFVGGSVDLALTTSREMSRITVGRNPVFTIPGLDFIGAPTGIDVRKVVELNLLPTINTGVAHKEAGVGQVGAGLVNPPWECFNGAIEAFVEHCRNQ
ncbi:MAG: DUF1116 domain-containing protein [Myxococcales bacterium]|jgi:hypothetical protein